MASRRKRLLPGVLSTDERASFTGREAQIDAFNHALDQDETHVISFCGIGGVGKTWLKRCLLTDVSSAEPPRPVGEVSFDVPELREPDACLGQLVDHFACCGWRFPGFAIALSECCRRRRKPEPAAAPLPTVSRWVALVARVLDHLVPNVPWKYATDLQDVVLWLHRVATRRSAFKRCPRLYELPLMPFADAQDLMVDVWAEEADWNLKRRGSPRPVVFLDQYESLAGAVCDIGHVQRERWVRDLVASTPHLLWVVFGRHELTWERDGGPVRPVLLPLKKFTEDEARKFLKRAGVDEPSVQDALARKACRLPLLLQLLTRAYVHRQNKDDSPIVDPLPIDKNLAERYLEGFTPELKLAAICVACFTGWDRKLFGQLIDADLISVWGDWDDLAKIDFVYPTDDGGWQMHDVVRELVVEYCEQEYPELFRRCQQVGFDFYKARLVGLQPQAIGSEHIAALPKASYHAKHVLDCAEFAEWLYTCTEPFRHAQMTLTVLPLFVDGHTHLAANCPPDAPELARAKTNLAWVLKDLGRFWEAETLFRESLGIAEGHGTNSAEVAVALADLGLLLKDEGHLDEASRHCERCLDILRRVGENANISLSKAIENLAWVCKDLGEKEQAVELFDELVKRTANEVGTEGAAYVEARMNLGIALKDAGRFDKSKTILEDCAARADAIEGSSPEVAEQARMSMGWLMFETDHPAEAADWFSRTLDTSARTFGEGSPKTLPIREGLAEATEKLGDVDGAVELMNRNIEIIDKVLGPENPRACDAHAVLGYMLERASRVTDAAAHFQAARRIAEKCYGEGSPRACEYRRHIEEAGEELLVRFDRAASVLGSALQLQLKTSVRMQNYTEIGGEYTVTCLEWWGGGHHGSADVYDSKIAFTADRRYEADVLAREREGIRMRVRVV